MIALHQTLLERYYAWEEARKLAKQDPSIYAKNGDLVYDEHLEDAHETSDNELLELNVEEYGSEDSQPDSAGFMSEWPSTAKEPERPGQSGPGRT